MVGLSHSYSVFMAWRRLFLLRCFRGRHCMRCWLRGVSMLWDDQVMRGIIRHTPSMFFGFRPARPEPCLWDLPFLFRHRLCVQPSCIVCGRKQFDGCREGCTGAHPSSSSTRRNSKSEMSTLSWRNFPGFVMQIHFYGFFHLSWAFEFFDENRGNFL